LLVYSHLHVSFRDKLSRRAGLLKSTE